ncbi:deSI-like protein At4g17486 [Dendrobium catenatum]|uniref:DeSI-like protein n=1 Tax=Dendrobium catenatum TaxID=906689 RepID=A0A2I0VMB7_9ASPA|nr:deSI-like protein At4g17486 [Dendrobium catenatum]PKU64558.1 DeSI-like protein [Dendrobium catenatum]
MFVRRRTVLKLRTGAVPVYLNVYDLTAINSYAYWLGLGVYHSGVQVHGVEYAYGAHDHPTTGIFQAEPRSCTGFAFRKSILIGMTDLGPSEVRELMDELAHRYTGNTYNLISKNCNHFCYDACLRLTGNGTPRWVNRLAKLGFLCKCVLPVQVAAVRSRSNDVNNGGLEGGRRRLRSGSIRYSGDENGGAAPSLKDVSRSSRRSRRPSSSSSADGGGVTSSTEWKSKAEL